MLIIFDCDGVLVDSESLAAQIFSCQLQTYGIKLDALECEKRFRGHTLRYCVANLEREYPGCLPQDFTEILSLATRNAFASQLAPVPGVEQVLQWLRSEKIDFCVASNGALAKIHHSLEVTGLRSYFGENCFSAESVRAGKPAPDLFLYAADAMGREVRRTLVVEDSPAGIAAALKAGMSVCIYGSASAAEGEAVYRFDQMSQLPRILKDWAVSLTDA